MRSSTLLPRSRVGACSPRTQRMASTTLDLPHPLGPTTAVIPGEKPIVVESRNDLKPSNSRLLRRMLPSPPPHHPPATNYPNKKPSEGQDIHNISYLGASVTQQIVDFSGGGTCALVQTLQPTP